MGSTAPAQPNITQQWFGARNQRGGAGGLAQNIAGAVQGSSYTIQFGDTMGEIVAALRNNPNYRGTGNPAEDIRLLAQANGISDPAKIPSGKTLDLSVLLGGGQQQGGQATPLNQAQGGGQQQGGQATPLNQAQGGGGVPINIFEQFARFQAQVQQQQLAQQQFNPFGVPNPVDPFLNSLGLGLPGSFGRAAALANINPNDALSIAGLLALNGLF